MKWEDIHEGLRVQNLDLTNAVFIVKKKYGETTWKVTVEAKELQSQYHEYWLHKQYVDHWLVATIDPMGNKIENKPFRGDKLVYFE